MSIYHVISFFAHHDIIKNQFVTFCLKYGIFISVQSVRITLMSIQRRLNEYHYFVTVSLDFLSSWFCDWNHKYSVRGIIFVEKELDLSNFTLWEIFSHFWKTDRSYWKSLIPLCEWIIYLPAENQDRNYRIGFSFQRPKRFSHIWPHLLMFNIVHRTCFVYDIAYIV